MTDETTEEATVSEWRAVYERAAATDLGGNGAEELAFEPDPADTLRFATQMISHALGLSPPPMAAIIELCARLETALKVRRLGRVLW